MSLNVIDRSKSSLIEDCILHPKYENNYNLSYDFADSGSYGVEIDLNEDGYDKEKSLLHTRFRKHYAAKFAPITSHIHVFQQTNRSILKKIDVWRELAKIENPLQTFNEVIEKSKYILDFTEGWDEDAGIPIEPVLFYTSSKIISDYIEAIYNEKGFIIKSPQINPVPDGSIDFEWRMESARMLINFRYEQKFIKAYYYGDLQNNHIPIKGSVPTDQVYEHLMKWMQFLK